MPHVVKTGSWTKAVTMVMVQAMAAAQAKGSHSHEETHFKNFLIHRSESGVWVHLPDYARRAAGRFSSLLRWAMCLWLFCGLF